MRRILTSVTILIGLTGCDPDPQRILGGPSFESTAPAVPSALRAEHSADRFTAPFVFYDVNPCDQDTVELTGEILVMEDVTVDAAGGEHPGLRIVPRGVRGEGQSGTVYQAVGGAGERVNIGAGGVPLTATFTSSFLLISQGGASDFIVIAVGHLTIDANGEVAVDFFREQAKCVGDATALTA